MDGWKTQRDVVILRNWKVEEKRRRICGRGVSFILRDDYVVDLVDVAIVVYDPTPWGLSRRVTGRGNQHQDADT
jgi:hypothetical protein